MTTRDNVFLTIKRRSDFLQTRGDQWSREIASAKNYVCTPNLKYWTFGKSAGIDMTYHYNGGAAKLWLYSLGFVNALDFPNGNLRKQIVASFLRWAQGVKGFDIAAKFQRDQENNKRFELLVHESVVDKKTRAQIDTRGKAQESFDDGFKREIVREIATRNQKVIRLARKKYPTVCCVCDFDFGRTYGLHGEGFIEMHHLYPISKGARRTTVDDLRPVCANCHRMLHRGVVMLEVDELRKIVNNHKYE